MQKLIDSHLQKFATIFFILDHTSWTVWILFEPELAPLAAVQVEGWEERKEREGGGDQISKYIEESHMKRIR